jgi:hypothetical protein
MFAQLLNDSKQYLKAILADDEYITLQAKILKKMHDSLVEAGFSAEQATKIVATQGAGTKAN